MNELTTGERLEDMLKDRGKTQAQISKEGAITQSVISRFKQGKPIQTDSLVKICKQLNVSADYLICLADDPTPDPDERAICEYTGLSSDAVSVLHDGKSSPDATGKTKENGLNTQLLGIVNILLTTDEGQHVLREILKFFHAQELQVPADPERNDRLILSRVGLVPDPGELIVSIDENTIETARIEAIRTALKELKNKLYVKNEGR